MSYDDLPKTDRPVAMLADIFTLADAISDNAATLEGSERDNPEARAAARRIGAMARQVAALADQVNEILPADRAMVQERN